MPFFNRSPPMDDAAWAEWCATQTALGGPVERDGWEHVLRSGEARYDVYGRGARIKFVARDNGAPERGDRTSIQDMSSRSRLDAAFSFENASCEWYGMSLLTWRHVPSRADVMRHCDRMRRQWRERWGEGMDGWIMEMHRRGVPHLHLFHTTQSNYGIQMQADPHRSVERVNSDGEQVETEIVGGVTERWLSETWMQVIGCRDAETLAFNRGGIIEVFRNPAGAARYVAKESSKRYQKILPERYKEGLGRWWYLARKWAPRRTITGTLSVDSLRDVLGWKHPLSRVWDASTLGDAIQTGKRVEVVIDIEAGTVSTPDP